ncbi:hypothetical protein JWG41_09035 [Leptospira sp. 201903075]|nr:hypothetical protein [Leptospira chreensis]MBM9590584.1 hypothetical protein [Leptospira chreensis]
MEPIIWAHRIFPSITIPPKPTGSSLQSFPQGKDFRFDPLREGFFF